MSRVVVVGLGPAGIIASAVLAGAGHGVVALQTDGGAGRCALVSPAPTVRRRAGEQAVAASAPPDGVDGVGGSKLSAAPQSYRLDPWVLRARSRTHARYGPEAPPAGTDLADWPIEPAELDEFHRKVERVMSVGVRAATPWTGKMSAAAAGLGWDPFPAPAAAIADCSVLLDRRRVEVREGAIAREIETDSTGSVTGVRIVLGGRHERIGCDAVVVAAAVVPTVRLLLMSGIDGNDQVGRHFMAHNCFVAHGWFPDVDLGRDAGGPAQATAVAEFDGDAFDHTGLGFLGGSVLQAAMTGPRTDGWRDAVARELPPDLAGPARAAEWVHAQQHSIGTVWAQPDQLPREVNRIDLDPDTTDPLGRPVARLTLDLADDDRARAKFLGARMCAWLEAAGARWVWVTELRPQPLGTHLYGGARMGTDPARSVVDGYGRCHTVRGLVVVGSSTFPGTGGRGPVQTVEALAWRSAQRLAQDLS
ncbi:GMC oxidoreductase [Nocardia sp. NPDC003963]